MNLLMGKARQKKFTYFILSVFPSGSLSYNQQKYCMQFRRWLNSGTMTFVEIVFQLSEIYRRTYNMSVII